MCQINITIMKKIVFLVVVILSFSCQNKEVLLPMAAETVVADVKDHSPIYMFFKIEGKDTLIDVNRKNSISSTNWLFNIDKRLPLKLLIPEIIKLQAKKEGSMHKSETSENYFTYTDTVKKTMAFLPFTNINYVLKIPSFGIKIFCSKSGKISVDGNEVKKENLQSYMYGLPSDKPNKFLFCFDSEMSFGNYIQNKVFLKSLKFSIPNINLINEEFIF